MPHSLAHWLELLATLCCGTFAGAAIYINAVEHPARMSCGVKVALTQWAPSYQRATVMQASLAVGGCLFAIGAWFAGAVTQVLVGGLVLVSVAPFTLIVIKPTNKRLLALHADHHAEEAAALLSYWNRLHSVRSLLSLIALLTLLLARSSP